jgi:hypothetical protein
MLGRHRQRRNPDKAARPTTTAPVSLQDILDRIHAINSGHGTKSIEEGALDGIVEDGGVPDVEDLVWRVAFLDQDREDLKQ